MPSEDTVEEVKRMSLTADGKSAVFDVPSKLAQVSPRHFLAYVLFFEGARMLSVYTRPRMNIPHNMADMPHGVDFLGFLHVKQT